MVKIVNPLGDVKIGRQGEVVYQRKYGEQIRRQASPKRAIASQRQIAHRQLYRDALTWRSQLTLANRRYLDGYCYTNRVVDSYHIPLPWSRFALKLYLQAVKFVPDLVVTQEEPQAAEKKEWTDEFAWTAYWKGKERWWAETITPLETYTLGKVGFLLSRHAVTMGNLLAGIRLTSGGMPTGDDLITAEADGQSIPIFASKAWFYITFPPTFELQQGVMYAVVMRAPDTPAYDVAPWRRDDDTNYPRGTGKESNNSGVDWSELNYDWQFEVWSAEIAGKYTKAGVLHVRHPALMKVVHKRNGVTINGYDTLSSLDEEYLTGQVGLDVEQGDTIKATTLPGIEYSYQVL